MYKKLIQEGKIRCSALVILGKAQVNAKSQTSAKTPWVNPHWLSQGQERNCWDIAGIVLLHHLSLLKFNRFIGNPEAGIFKNCKSRGCYRLLPCSQPALLPAAAVLPACLAPSSQSFSLQIHFLFRRFSSGDITFKLKLVLRVNTWLAISIAFINLLEYYLL